MTTSDGRVAVRARARGDLEALGELAGVDLEIAATPDRDYAFRVFMRAVEWVKFARVLAADVDYPNFKNEIHKHDHERAYLYGKVWAVMHQGLAHERKAKP